MASFCCLLGHFGRLQAPNWLAGGLRNPPGSMLGGILDAFLMIFEGFLHLSPPSFFDEFPGRCLERFPSEFVVFSFRAKTADKRNLQYLPTENQYSPRCALAPAPRLRRRRRQKTHAKTTSRNREKSSFSCFLRAGRPCRKEAPKMTSRRLSGTLPGTLWEPPGTPWEAQDDPKRRPERPKKAPGAAPGRPGADQKGLKSRPRLRGASGELGEDLEELWEGLGELLESFGRVWERFVRVWGGSGTP